MASTQSYIDSSHTRTAPNTSQEPSLGTLFSKLTEDFSTLVQKEVELARTEAVESVSTILRSAVSMIAGGVIAYAGLIILLLAAAFGLANVIPLWVSALAIGLITLVIGGILISAGRNAISNVNIVPKKTVQTIKNDARMVQEKLS